MKDAPETGQRRILIVDDDAASAKYMALALSGAFPLVKTCQSASEALQALERMVPDLVISDLRMPGMDGLELLIHIKDRWPALPVILVTVQQDVASIVEAVRSGAVNYLIKPIPPNLLQSSAARALAAFSADHAPANGRLPEIVGASRSMVQVRSQVALAARSEVNVLLVGETGTGKELVARSIHRLSSASDRPFIAHNCALTPPELFESQFFGHRRGSFTGAFSDQLGLLEEADGSLLFLDELECLSLPHQAKLLRVMDDGEVRPVGARGTRSVSVRYLGATNRAPRLLLDSGLLRDDLYYRLRGFEIHLPPLRERREDIPLLVQHFLRKQGDAASVTARALEALTEAQWPGNVRQLQNELARAGAVAGKGPIRLKHLALHAGSAAGHGLPEKGERATLEKLESEAIFQVLRQFDGNRTRAARALGIDRSTLRRKMRKAGIAYPAIMS
ncbi:MAG: sigma-54-dependent transcriptional regulator [Acidobacteriota bacterium]